MTVTTSLEKWRQRVLENGELTPRQMTIYRMLKRKGPLQTVQVILELSQGPVISPIKRRGIETDLKTLEQAGFLRYDFSLHDYWVSPCGRMPKGA